MTPYLIVSNKYSSSIGLGKDDLFWKLNLLMGVSNSISTTIQIKVKDRDMFFDDSIGSAVVIVPAFNVHAQVQQQIKQKIDNKQHTVLKLGQYTHVSYDIKNGDKLAGRIRVQYRYVPVLPVLILLDKYDRNNRQVEVEYESTVDMDQVYNWLRKNRHMRQLRYDDIMQEVLQIALN